jgi:hypothetical protein
LSRRAPDVPRSVAEVIDLALGDRPEILVKSAAALRELLEREL